jgi:hypothetical protein
MTKKYILGNNCCRVLLCSNHLHSLLQCNSHMEMGVCIDPLMKRWHYVQALSLQLHKCIITAYIIKNGKFLQEYKCLDRCEIKKTILWVPNKYLKMSFHPRGSTWIWQGQRSSRLHLLHLRLWCELWHSFRYGLFCTPALHTTHSSITTL